jgi:phosphatidylserine/phosphatidylglycerophosphate/cardiolipin synthase-like enzyme
MLVVETGYSDGGTGAGTELVVSDLATGDVLETYVVDADGITELPMPEVPYTVTLDGGPGHRVTKDGPLPEAAAPEAASQPERGSLAMVNVLQGAPKQLTETQRARIAEAEVVVCFERIARRLADRLANATVIVVDDSVPLGGASDQAAQLRERVAARIEEALALGDDVAVLTEGPVEDSADWSWVEGAAP